MMRFLLDIYSTSALFSSVNKLVLIMPPWINSEKFELQKKARPAQECLRALLLVFTLSTLRAAFEFCNHT